MTDTELLDKNLAATLRKIHRARWYAVLVLTLITLAAIAIFSDVVISQQRELAASCAFYGELGTLNIAPPKGGPPPSRLAVELVAHSRFTYLHQDCGSLPAPDPALRQYAARYGIRIPG